MPKCQRCSLAERDSSTEQRLHLGERWAERMSGEAHEGSNTPPILSPDLWRPSGQASRSHGDSAWMDGTLAPVSGSLQRFLLRGWASSLILHSAYCGGLHQIPHSLALTDTPGARPVGIADQPACAFTNTLQVGGVPADSVLRRENASLRPRQV